MTNQSKVIELARATLEECKRWHQGDNWREARESALRAKWEDQLCRIDQALSLLAAQAEPASNSSRCQHGVWLGDDCIQCDAETLALQPAQTVSEQPSQPEAGNETSALYNWLERAARCGLPEVEHAARTMMAYYQGAEFPALASQPVAQQPAQELPPLPFSPLLCIDWADKRNTKTLYTADQMRDYARLSRAQSAAPAAAPEGWKLVPIGPTRAMIDAAAAADPERESVWAAYLSAAPQPVAAQVGEKGGAA